MDEQRFDDLTKRVSSSSRRQVLSSLLGGFAAVGLRDLAAAKKEPSVCKGKGKSCPSGTTCCNRNCVPTCTAPDVPDPITCACPGCEPLDCGTIQVQDPATCQCICPNSCSSGQLQDPVSCYCFESTCGLSTCPSGTICCSYVPGGDRATTCCQPDTTCCPSVRTDGSPDVRCCPAGFACTGAGGQCVEA